MKLVLKQDQISDVFLNSETAFMYLGEALVHAAAYFRHPNMAPKVKNRLRLNVH